jgi:hypothetical protein
MKRALAIICLLFAAAPALAEDVRLDPKDCPYVIMLAARVVDGKLVIVEDSAPAGDRRSAQGDGRQIALAFLPRGWPRFGRAFVPRIGP